MRYPDFLCIGAQKSGTTWLYHQFQNHPQIWQPLIKELHFFDKCFGERRIKHLFKISLFGKSVRHTLRQGLYPKKTIWVFKYLVLPSTLKNYPKLFNPSSDQICGEITPAYARLPIERIESMHNEMQDTKIIYLLRNPIERVWSQMMMYKRQFNLSESKESLDNIRSIKEEGALANSSYIENITNWEQVYPKEQIFIGFFDQITEEPKDLLSDIYSFLGIERSSGIIESQISKKQNAGENEKMPIHLKKRYSRILLPELVSLHERFQNSYTRKWLDEANHILNK